MSTNDIPLDKAELLAVVLEAFLYGFSLFMFGGTIWALSSQRSTLQVNRKMLAVACSLLLFSTVHLVIDIIRVMEGFILLPSTYPGGRISYFSDVSHWTFVAKNYVYAAQTLLGDGVVLYRCYAVWQSKLVMILPALLWCAVGVTGFSCPYTESLTKQGGVFEESLSRWITSFWTSSLATNIVTTLMLAYRIWYVDRNATNLCDHRKSELRPILLIIIDAGTIYSLTLFAALICYVNKSNGQIVVVDMIMPIISITFYMVIIRVGLANRANHLVHTNLGHTSPGNSLVGDRRSRVHPPLNKLDDGHHSWMSPTSPVSSKQNRQSEVRFDGIKEEVSQSSSVNV
ncbi:hypothetical protein OG21DRAFT_1419724 [Imleria badia]|nr:hypothetical protein OG21DRAFT_1419724 [Imleria badia]